jgi:L-alanine-DL-glutamate epimerase-like enolase superfamily enzyme
MRAYITARKPADLAQEVERWRKRGCTSFVLRRINGDGSLDRERLGAARYAAGLQAEVELDGDAADFSEAASR